MLYPKPLQQLIEQLKRFPGVGTKTAERFAFSILDWQVNHREQLAQTLHHLHHTITHCPTCSALQEADGCRWCTDPSRDSRALCLVASPRDIFAIESTHEFRGRYHVLGALLSPLEGIERSHLNLPTLHRRLTTEPVEELVIALDSTLEGDATALLLKEELARYPLSLSRLAFGLAMGSSLDYVDRGTLARALSARKPFG